MTHCTYFPDVGLVPPLSDGGECHLGRLAILKEARGSGFGKLLVEAVHQEARRKGKFIRAHRLLMRCEIDISLTICLYLDRIPNILDSCSNVCDAVLLKNGIQGRD